MQQLRTNFRMAGKALLVLVIALLTFSTALFAQELIWAKRAGGPNAEIGRGIAVDGSGNSYVTGNFEGTATFSLGEGV